MLYSILRLITVAAYPPPSSVLPSYSADNTADEFRSSLVQTFVTIAARSIRTIDSINSAGQPSSSSRSRPSSHGTTSVNRLFVYLLQAEAKESVPQSRDSLAYLDAIDRGSDTEVKTDDAYAQWVKSRANTCPWSSLLSLVTQHMLTNQRPHEPKQSAIIGDSDEVSLGASEALYDSYYEDIHQIILAAQPTNHAEVTTENTHTNLLSQLSLYTTLLPQLLRADYLTLDIDAILKNKSKSSMPGIGQLGPCYYDLLHHTLWQILFIVQDVLTSFRFVKR